MILCVYGDAFRVRERVKELKDAFRAKHDPTGLNFTQFPSDGQKVNPSEVLQSALASPFLGARRMVIVRDAVAGAKKEAEKSWAGAERVPESTVLVFVDAADTAAVEKTALFKILSTFGAKMEPLTSPSGAELAKWIIRRAVALGVGISADAAQELALRTGGDLWQTDAELNKLAAFAGSATITSLMVTEMVRPAFEGQMFALMDAVSQKRTREALRMLEEERQAGSADFYLLSMLQRQIRLLFSARLLLDDDPRATSPQAAEVLGAAPFVAGKVLSQARGFSSQTLREAHTLTYSFDVGSKSGRIDAGLAVDLLFAKLLGA